MGLGVGGAKRREEKVIVGKRERAIERHRGGRRHRPEARREEAPVGKVGGRAAVRRTAAAAFPLSFILHRHHTGRTGDEEKPP